MAFEIPKPAFVPLFDGFPDETVYKKADFRVEWGPVFHRGRLDGSAKLLVIGQDPAQHENIARRILVGEAGQRAQGFFAKLGITDQYVMINAFLYSALSSGGLNAYDADPGVVAYRNQWIDAVMKENAIVAVLAFGGHAETAWKAWKSANPGSAGAALPFRKVTHPTAPESAANNDPAKLAAETTKLLTNWNAGLTALAPAFGVASPPQYGAAWAPGDRVGIPVRDMAPGTPAWMAGLDNWAFRVNDAMVKHLDAAVKADATAAKRFTIAVEVPTGAR